MKSTPNDPMEFYTEYRYKGDASACIHEFAAAMRGLITRLQTDLNGDDYGNFGGRRKLVMKALAETAPAMLSHVDTFERLAIDATDDEQDSLAIRNIVANVASDHNFSGQARARAETPTARESKFDQGLGGTIIGETPEIANKLNDLSTFYPPLALIAAIVRNIGIFGRTALELSGGDEVGEQLENKLEFVIDQNGGIKTRIDNIIVNQGEHRIIIERIDSETQTIEQKLLILGRLLGRTLVGEPWNVEPLSTSPNKVPERDVKQELHDIEDLLRMLIIIVTGWTPPPPPEEDEDWPLPPVPPTPEIPPLVDKRIKKIFVYEEGVFEPSSASEEKIIKVQTEAFDLFGWLDLSEMRSGDAVQASLYVSILGRPPVLFDQALFSRPGLYTLADFAKGQSKVSGNRIEVKIRQTRSRDNFASVVSIPYQMIVESQ